jgi:hypothetical protein
VQGRVGTLPLQDLADERRNDAAVGVERTVLMAALARAERGFSRAGPSTPMHPHETLEIRN